MAALVFLVVLLLVLGAASALGWSVDSRDPSYGLGAVIDPRGDADAGRVTP
jgi:hypothetical protein